MGPKGNRPKLEGGWPTCMNAMSYSWAPSGGALNEAAFLNSLGSNWGAGNKAWRQGQKYQTLAFPWAGVCGKAWWEGG